MSETKIKVGSVVLLNSDGNKSPKMTVNSISDNYTADLAVASVVWRTADGTMVTGSVALKCLRLAEDYEDESIPPG